MSVEKHAERVERAVDVIEKAVAENRGWFIALGVVLIALGIIAIGAPFATTIVAKIFLGWIFLIAGISQAIHAFFAPRWKGVVWNLLIGLLYAVVGAWLAFFPLTGIISLTVLLAATFVVEGLFKSVIGFHVRQIKGGIWMMISGIIAVAAGALILIGLPSTATWAIGLLVGINILMSGVAFVLLAWGARSDISRLTMRIRGPKASGLYYRAVRHHGP